MSNIPTTFTCKHILFINAMIQKINLTLLMKVVFRNNGKCAFYDCPDRISITLHLSNHFETKDKQTKKKAYIQISSVDYEHFLRCSFAMLYCKTASRKTCHLGSATEINPINVSLIIRVTFIGFI